MLYAYLRCHLFPFIWCFLGFYLLKHTSSYYKGKSNIELTIWRFFLVLLVCSFDSWGSDTDVYIWTFVLPSLSLPFSCDLPFVRSLTLVRTIKIDHFTAAGVTTYIYVYLLSPFFFLFSFLFMTGSICGWRMRLSAYGQNWFIIIEQNRHTHTSFFSFLNILYKCPIVYR